ncbi:MAG: NAD(P)/FAD-dependent oxidoreductase [Acidimicrobiia bacterium]
MAPVPDTLVIGAGPNGLVAANLLADAGRRVLVLEAQPAPGGAVRSAELTLPGHTHDLCSAFYPLGVASPVLRSLGLEEHGLTWRRAPLVLAHPTGDRCVALSTDCDETAASLGAFAPADADAWRRMADDFERAAPSLLDAVTSPFPPVRATASLAGALGPRRVARLGRIALSSAERLARTTFRGEGGALLLAGNALHADVALDRAPSGFLGWLLAGLGQRVGFPVPEGGAGRLTDALVARLLGARRHRAVRHLGSAGGRARRARGRGTTRRRHRGRRTHGRARRRRRARAVPRPRGQGAPAGAVRWGLRRFRWDDATFKVDWALSAPIPWRHEAATRAGTVHLGDDLATLTAYQRDLAAGRLPTRPFVLLGQMHVADPTRSPAGTGTAWAYTHVPRGLPWDPAAADAFADRLEAEIERHAPGFRGVVAARHLLPPPALEALDANLVDGAIGGGTMALRQQLVLRPVPGLGGPGTPIRNLWLASASAHPGGGVHGACGANAARAALRTALRAS